MDRPHCRAWLYKAARNIFTDKVRRATAERERMTALDMQEAQPDTAFDEAEAAMLLLLLPPELISQHLQISDCATVVCTEEQTAAVSLIATDVGGVGEKDGKGIFGMIDGIFNQNSDTKMINASNYKL